MLRFAGANRIQWNTRLRGLRLSSNSSASARSRGPRYLLGAGPRLSHRQFHASSIARMEDPYEVLGVSRDASARDIKKKYYQLAKKYHPDINKETDADKKFQNIQSSYEILSDESKRKQYDQMGAAAFEGGAAGPGGGTGNPFDGFGGFNPFGGASAGGFGGFEDIFSAFTGQSTGKGQGRGAGRQVYQGEDLEVVAQLTLEEAARGVNKPIKYSVIDECNTCHGSGLKAGETAKTCGTCHGTGSAVHVIQGGFQMASTCPTCHGSGVVIPKSSRCGSCHGEGTTNSMKQYEVQIPAGIQDGMRIRERGEGDAPQIRKGLGVMTTKGDLYIRVHVKPHLDFKREKDDLRYSANIPFTTAALGGAIEIPTLNGSKVRVSIPSCSQYGDEIVIPGQGMPVSPLSSRSRMSGGSARGDLKVSLKIKTPRPADETQTVLLEAFADAIGDKNARRKFASLHDVHDEHAGESSEPVNKDGLFKRLINKVLKKDQ